RFMITRIILATVAIYLAAPFTFGQVKYSRLSPTPTATPGTPVQSQRTMRPRSTLAPPPPGSATFQRTMLTSSRTMSSQRTTARQVQPQPSPWPAQAPPKPTPTPVPPPDIQAYLGRQLANSKDQKFHMTVNGKDLALRPFHVWPQKSTGANSTSTCVDMR